MGSVQRARWGYPARFPSFRQSRIDWGTRRAWQRLQRFPRFPQTLQQVGRIGPVAQLVRAPDS